MPVETQQTEQTESQQPQPGHSPGISRAEDGADDIEEDDPLIIQSRTTYDRVYEMVELFAATRIGQYVIERADGALRTVEDTAKWSLPEDKTSETNLERPMSWIPFLCLIVILRLIRVALSIAAFMIGNGPVTPQDVVYFIQTRRRKLRAIRFHGLKARSEHDTEKNSSQSSSTQSIFGKLRTLFASAICRPGMHREAMRRYVPSDAKTERANDISATTSTTAPKFRSSAKRPRDDDESPEEDCNLTVDQMLNKYANADSDDDSDYVADAHETTNDDDNTSSGTSEAGSGDEAEVQNNAPVKKVESKTSEDVEATNEGASSTTNGTTNNTNISNNHNQSVELVENKNQSTQESHPKKSQAMPIPIIEIKKEHSTSEEQLTSHTPKENGGDTWESDVARQNANIEQQNTVLQEQEITTMMKPKVVKLGLGNATATAVQSIEMMGKVQTPKESRKFRKKCIISCSSTISISTSSSSSSSLSSSLSLCSCVKSRLSISQSCIYVHSHTRSRSLSQSRSRSRSCTSISFANNDNCSDLDSFHSLDDVNMNMNIVDNLFELETETTRSNASHVASETENQTAALTIQKEFINKSAPTIQIEINNDQQSTEQTYQYNSSSTEDEFYSPVGSPEDSSIARHYKSPSTESETPKEYENQSTSDQTSAEEQQSYGHKHHQKHTHHQNQQQHHKHHNRYNNRNRR